VTTEMALEDRATEPLAGLRVMHLGHYDPSYSRNRLVHKALRLAGAEVIPMTDGRRFARRLPNLAKEVFRSRPDVALVGFPGHADVPAAWVGRAVRHVPVIFDAFVSLYEAAVEDRGQVRRKSFAAARYWLEDAVACRLSDRVLLDTQAHVDYFRERFRIDENRLRRVWVGADDEFMFPRPQPPGERLRVFFYGSFIPLHGLEYILRAARLLEAQDPDTEFVFAGTGQTFPAVRRLERELGLRTTRFLGRVPYQRLPALMAEADVCLGIFGTTPKARRVIPNKVFDALAMARPLITADTPAVREGLRPGEECLLCPAGDSEALADAISWVRDHRTEAAVMAERGRQRFLQEFSPSALAVDMARIFSEVLDGR
jgi:glycosyltransferase involved in cell wall biosynthesis